MWRAHNIRLAGGEGSEPEKCNLISWWPVWDLAVYVPTGDYPDLSHKTAD